MSRAFYKAVHGVKNGFKSTWNFVCGHTAMKKAGLEPDYQLQGGLAMAGIVGGLIVAGSTGMATKSFTVFAAVWGMGASLPVMVLLPYSLYKAGEQHERLRIQQQKLKLLTPSGTGLL